MQDQSSSINPAESARAMLGDQQRAAAGGLGNFAEVLRRAARESGGDNSQVSRYAETAADTLQRFSESLRNRDLDSLVRDAESFARRQPVMFMGAAMVAGFFAMRLLKASNSNPKL